MRRAKIPELENALIAQLRPQARRELLRRCEQVELAYGEVLCEADSPLAHVYFPLTGFISRRMILDSEFPIDLGLIGNEGMLGAILLISIRDAPMRAVVQSAGSALRMSAPAFRRALREIAGFLQIVQRYLYLAIEQLARLSACARYHPIEPRLASWLLMIRDHSDADRFYVTQGSLADNLGVRRAGVTVAAGQLKRKKLIRYCRGEIVILNRKGLEAAACSCYAAMRRDLAPSGFLIAHL